MDPTVLASLVIAGVALIGVIVGGIRFIIRVAQYLARSEEAQTSTAKSAVELVEQFKGFKAETKDEFSGIHAHLSLHDREIAALNERTKDV